jgi:hypothetical protein
MNDTIDDDIDEETLRRVQGWIERDEAVVDGAMSELYGNLPKWVPAPAIDRARRTVQGLINGGFDAANIRARVAEELAGQSVLVPGIVRDAGAYFRAINELAHLKYAISRGKADGLLILAGKQAAHGQTFLENRKQGFSGPIRTAIASLLEQQPTMSNAELWAAIAAHPPRGWTACENRQGKYLESYPRGRRHEVVFKTFQNHCAEERKKLSRGKIPE